MKKEFMMLCAAVSVAVLSACGSSKNVPSLASIEGEWNIIEINGSAVVPAAGQTFPFIGFDTQEGTIHGNAGCNSLLGSFDTKAEPGTIDLSGMGATRMMCPDMTLEDNILKAFAQVKKYKVMDDENIALCNGKKKPVLVLKKK